MLGSNKQAQENKKKFNVEISVSWKKQYRKFAYRKKQESVDSGHCINCPFSEEC